MKHIICAAAPADLGEDILRYETLAAAAGDEAIAEYRLRAARVASDDVATIIYTSGTTGEPKGVVLTHNNLSSNEEVSAESFAMSPDDTAVSFLPLSHVYERVIDYAYLFRGVHVAYVERMDDLPQALLEVRPTLSAAVPRVFEKLFALRLGDWCCATLGEVACLRRTRAARAADQLGHCQPRGVFQNSRRRRRPHARVHLWRRTALARTC